MSISNPIARRRRLSQLLSRGELGVDVLAELLPGGEPLPYERAFWDYKLSVPELGEQVASPDDKRTRQRAYGELIKDVVAFYNSYGGYLLIGVRDSPREVVGFDGTFDCDELNRMLRAATRHEIECHFAALQVPESRKKVGLIHIPRRPDSKEPAQFLRDAPQGPGGDTRAYRRGSIYFRQGDECKPANASEDFMFLCSPSRRANQEQTFFKRPTLMDHNFPPRDPEFVRFIGRQDDLDELWRWICDEFSPLKLLSGLGGVGKTTLAREFVEEFWRCAPMGYEKVIWLSAKPRFYTAIKDGTIAAPRVDFSTTTEMLRALLAELGTPDEEIEEEWSITDLQAEIVEALVHIPSLVVIDDVDSLAALEQSQVFHSCLQITNQLTGRAKLPSRALLTARLELGAAPGQLKRVSGLPYNAFCDFVVMMTSAMEIPWKYGPTNKLMKRFHRTTDGSPLFANSILRLVQLGERLAAALDAWQDSAGEDVRRFAFQRELAALTGSQQRTLYAVCLLGETSFAELLDVTESSESLLRDDVGALRNYHLVSTAGEIPIGGPKLAVPENIRLMRDILAEKLPDPRRIEKRCERAGSTSRGLEHEVGKIVRRVVALWNSGETVKALGTAEWAVKKYPKEGDLQCLLARALLALAPPRARAADVAIRKAFDLGCRRREVPDLWIEARRLSQDWIGVIEVVEMVPNELISGDHIWERGKATMKMAEDAYRAGKKEVAAEGYKRAGVAVDSAFKKGSAKGRVHDLTQLRWEAFRLHVEILLEVRSRPEEQLDVWLATLDSFTCYVRSPSILRVGIERLKAWWRAVESRSHPDGKAADLLAIQLRQLEEMVAWEQALDEREDGLGSYLESNAQLLREKLGSYEERLKESI